MPELNYSREACPVLRQVPSANISAPDQLRSQPIMRLGRRVHSRFIQCLKKLDFNESELVGAKVKDIVGRAGLSEVRRARLQHKVFLPFRVDKSNGSGADRYNHVVITMNMGSSLGARLKDPFGDTCTIILYMDNGSSKFHCYSVFVGQPLIKCRVQHKSRAMVSVIHGPHGPSLSGSVCGRAPEAAAQQAAPTSRNGRRGRPSSSFQSAP